MLTDASTIVFPNDAFARIHGEHRDIKVSAIALAEENGVTVIRAIHSSGEQICAIHMETDFFQMMLNRMNPAFVPASKQLWLVEFALHVEDETRRWSTTIEIPGGYSRPQIEKLLRQAGKKKYESLELGKVLDIDINWFELTEDEDNSEDDINA